jgi:dTDP-4-dehydrorhamnose reductase
MNRTLLITGASGQLGQRTAREALAAGWRVVGTFQRAPLETLPIEWQVLDFLDHAAIDHLVGTVRPAAVINTAVRMRPSAIWGVNADGAAAVAKAAVKVGARLVHMSTDALFDGEKTSYGEADDPSPVTLYGASKAAAETAVRALAPEAVVVRTSLILDDDPLDNHSRMVLDIARGLRPEKLFTDELRCPIAAVDLARVLLELIELPVAGILNVAGADAVSRHELGVLVARRYGLDPATVPATTLAASGLRRPPDLRLDTSRARALLATRLRGAREFLAVPVGS